ncbi:hypothetical protein WJX73_000067 [Symbiochloris irregularis]|uniref:BZIP domain-containing protein n=1 Tax=Symbiochloris irregularis TaxID=706552 RepID=A0AAW1P029_9CHLO
MLASLHALPDQEALRVATLSLMYVPRALGDYPTNFPSQSTGLVSSYNRQPSHSFAEAAMPAFESGAGPMSPVPPSASSLGHREADGAWHDSDGSTRPADRQGSPASSDHEGSLADQASEAARKASCRKTEQNRRSQQRYRRRRKEMFEEQQRLNIELSLQIEHLMQKHSHTQARANFLEEMIGQKESAMHGAGGMASANEGSLLVFAQSLADLVQITRQGIPHDLASTQQLLLQAASDLLAGQYAALAFVRKEMVMLLIDYLMQLDQQPLGAASSCIFEIICTYNKALQRAGAAHAEALLTYLALPVQPGRQGLQEALQAMALSSEQEQQLLRTHAAFLAAVGQLQGERAGLTSTLQSSQPSTLGQAQSLFSIVQGQTALTSLQQTIREERRQAVEFYSLAVLALDPVQHARALVASYPSAVDMMAICGMLAERPRLDSHAGMTSHLEQRLRGDAQGLGPPTIVTPGASPHRSMAMHRLPTHTAQASMLPQASQG